MLVYIIDDDEGMRYSLSFVLNNAGHSTACFSSAKEVLDDWEHLAPGCLIVDFLMPGMTGVQLVEEIRTRGSMTPFILVTGHGTVRIAVQAMRLGAVSVIEKPFSHDEILALLDSVQESLKQGERQRQSESEGEHVIQRINSLTAREYEVMELVVKGDLTKQIAKQLGISTKTVEVHRSNITRKMGVQSVAQLVKQVVSANLRSN